VIKFGFHHLEKIERKKEIFRKEKNPRVCQGNPPPHPWDIHYNFSIKTLLSNKRLSSSRQRGPVKPNDLFNKWEIHSFFFKISELSKSFEQSRGFNLLFWVLLRQNRVAFHPKEREKNLP